MAKKEKIPPVTRRVEISSERLAEVKDFAKPLEQQLEELFGKEKAKELAKSLREVYGEDNVNGVKMPAGALPAYQEFRRKLFSGSIKILAEDSKTIESRGIEHPAGTLFGGLYDPFSGEGAVILNKDLGVDELRAAANEETLHAMHFNINPTINGLLNDVKARKKDFSQEDRAKLTSFLNHKNALTEAFIDYVLDPASAEKSLEKLEAMDESFKTQFLSNTRNLGLAYIGALKKSGMEDEQVSEMLFSCFDGMQAPVDENSLYGEGWADLALRSIMSGPAPAISKHFDRLTEGRHTSALETASTLGDMLSGESLEAAALAATYQYPKPTIGLNINCTGEGITYGWENSDDAAGKNLKPIDQEGFGNFIQWGLRYWLAEEMPHMAEAGTAVDWAKMNQAFPMLTLFTDIERRRMLREMGAVHAITTPSGGAVDLASAGVMTLLNTQVGDNVFMDFDALMSFRDKEGRSVANLLNKRFVMGHVSGWSFTHSKETEGDPRGGTKALGDHIWDTVCDNLEKHRTLGSVLTNEEVEALRRDESLKSHFMVFGTYLYTHSITLWRMHDNSTKRNEVTSHGALDKDVYASVLTAAKMNEELPKEEKDLMSYMWSAIKPHFIFQSKPGKEYTPDCVLKFLNGIIMEQRQNLEAEGITEEWTHEYIEANPELKRRVGELTKRLDNSNSDLTLSGNLGGWLENIYISFANRKIGANGSAMKSINAGHIYDARTGFKIDASDSSEVDHVYDVDGVPKDHEARRGRYVADNSGGVKYHVRECVLDGRGNILGYAIKVGEDWRMVDSWKVEPKTGEILEYTGKKAEDFRKLNNTEISGIRYLMFEKHTGKVVRDANGKAKMAEEDAVKNLWGPDGHKFFDEVNDDLGVRLTSKAHKNFVDNGIFQFFHFMAQEKFQKMATGRIRDVDSVFTGEASSLFEQALTKNICRLLYMEEEAVADLDAQELLDNPEGARGALGKVGRMVGSRWAAYFSDMGDRFAAIPKMSEIRGGQEHLNMMLLIRHFGFAKTDDPTTYVGNKKSSYDDLCRTYTKEEVERVRNLDQPAFMTELTEVAGELNSDIKAFQRLKRNAIQMLPYFINHPEVLQRLCFSLDGRDWRVRAIKQPYGTKDGEREKHELRNGLSSKELDELRRMTGGETFELSSLMVLCNVVEDMFYESILGGRSGAKLEDSIAKAALEHVKKFAGRVVAHDGTEFNPRMLWDHHIKLCAAPEFVSEKGESLPSEQAVYGTETSDVAALKPEERAHQGLNVLFRLNRLFEEQLSLYNNKRAEANRDSVDLWGSADIADKSGRGETIRLIQGYMFGFPTEREEDNARQQLGRGRQMLRSLGKTFEMRYKGELKSSGKTPQDRAKAEAKMQESAAEKIFQFLVLYNERLIQEQMNYDFVSSLGMRGPSILREYKNLTDTVLGKTAECEIRLATFNQEQSRLPSPPANERLMEGLNVSARQYAHRTALITLDCDPVMRLFTHDFAKRMGENQEKLDEIERRLAIGEGNTVRGRKGISKKDGLKETGRLQQERLEIFNQSMIEFVNQMVSNRVFDEASIRPISTSLTSWIKTYGDGVLKQSAGGYQAAINSFTKAFSNAEDVMRKARASQDPDLEMFGRVLQIMTLNARGRCRLDAHDASRSIEKGYVQGEEGVEISRKDSKAARKRALENAYSARIDFQAAWHFSRGFKDPNEFIAGQGVLGRGVRTMPEEIARITGLGIPHTQIKSEPLEYTSSIFPDESLDAMTGIMAAHSRLKHDVTAAEGWFNRIKKALGVRVTGGGELDFSATANRRILELDLAKNIRARARTISDPAMADSSSYLAKHSLRNFAYYSGEEFTRSSIRLLYMNMPEFLTERIPRFAKEQMWIGQAAPFIDYVCSRQIGFTHNTGHIRSFEPEADVKVEFKPALPEFAQETSIVSLESETRTYDSLTGPARGLSRVMRGYLQNWVAAAPTNIEMPMSWVDRIDGVRETNLARLWALWVPQWARYHYGTIASQSETANAGVRRVMGELKLQWARTGGQARRTETDYQAALQLIYGSQQGVAQHMDLFRQGKLSTVQWFSELQELQRLDVAIQEIERETEARNVVLTPTQFEGAAVGPADLKRGVKMPLGFEPAGRTADASMFI